MTAKEFAEKYAGMDVKILKAGSYSDRVGPVLCYKPDKNWVGVGMYRVWDNDGRVWVVPAEMRRGCYFTKPENLQLVNENTKAHKSYPHKCPACGQPAFVGFTMVDCSKNCKQERIR